MCHAIPVSTNLIQSRLHISYGTIPAYIPSQRRPQWILIYKGQILPIRSQRSTQCTIAGFIQLIVYYIAPHIERQLYLCLHLQYFASADTKNIRNVSVPVIHTVSYPRNLQIHRYADCDRDLHSCWRAVAM